MYGLLLQVHPTLCTFDLTIRVKASFRSEPPPPVDFGTDFSLSFFLFFFPKKKTVDFGTVDLPECQEPPLLPKKTVDFDTVDLP